MQTAIEKELNSYIHELNTTQKKSLLQYIKTIFPDKKKETITIEQYNRELEEAEAEAEIERGEYYTLREALEIFKNHLLGKK